MSVVGEGDLAWRRRLDAFAEFDKGVFNILKLAMAYDLTAQKLREVERDIALTIPPNAKQEMLRYTDRVVIIVHGSQRKVGWWWKRRLHKHISAEITFDPYRTTLSVWTDKDGELVCFQ